MPADKPTPGLYLLATPIGAAKDITLHCLELLASLDILVAEDTRVLRKLMDIHGISLGGRQMKSYHDHSKAGEREWILDQIAQGKSVGYASDAGTPMIADPGFDLVRDAYERGFTVEVAPGASALTAAIALSGLPSDRVYFGSFLPSKSGARQKTLENIAALEASLVFYESPKRVIACLEDMMKIFGPERAVALCREITKKFQQIARGSLLDVHTIMSQQETIKGEIVLVLGPPLKKEVSEAEIRELLTPMLQKMSTKAASQSLAEQLNLPRKQIYSLALDIKNDSSRSSDA